MNLESVFVLKSLENGYVSAVSGEKGKEKLTFSDFWMDAKPFMDFDSDKDDPLPAGREFSGRSPGS